MTAAGTDCGEKLMRANRQMTFAQALELAAHLRETALLAIALRASDEEKRRAISACIQFNPYKYRDA